MIFSLCVFRALRGEHQIGGFTRYSM